VALFLDPPAAPLCFRLVACGAPSRSISEALVPLSAGEVEEGAALAWLSVLLVGCV
jgi:hypothetical protein